MHGYLVKIIRRKMLENVGFYLVGLQIPFCLYPLHNPIDIGCCHFVLVYNLRIGIFLLAEILHSFIFNVAFCHGQR